jgi:hypothetical protein
MPHQNENQLEFSYLYKLSEEDARTAFEAIAAKRIIARCECDSDVGYRCKRCEKLVSRGGDVMQYESELAYRYGQHLMARHLLKATKPGDLWPCPTSEEKSGSPAQSAESIGG